MDVEFIWTDGIELALNDIKNKSSMNSEYHKKNYYFFKGYLKYFRVPTIVLSGLNSVFSVGLQPYISQDTISILCCSISLICGIIASLELFVGIQNMMEKELISSKEFYILSSDIFKTLSVERQYRFLNGKIYLDYIHTKYCNLIEQSNLLYKKIEFIQNIKENINEEIEQQIEESKHNIEELKHNIEESKHNIEESKHNIEESKYKLEETIV
jgi:hypothetical protein